MVDILHVGKSVEAVAFHYHQMAGVESWVDSWDRDGGVVCGGRWNTFRIDVGSEGGEAVYIDVLDNYNYM